MKLTELLKLADIKKSNFAKSIGISRGELQNKLNQNLVNERFTPEQLKNITKKIKAIKEACEKFLNKPEI